MEGENENVVMDVSIDPGGRATPASTRWNPTKEQISMLERFYKQGMRTPTAEQIQQIANRLRSFGHIEGKNVFYWFQNHKARQRQRQKQKQKQKQENMACSNFRHYGLYKANSHFFPPPLRNVDCSSYYFMRPRSDDDNCISKRETLPLFPLEPTGIIQARSIISSSSVHNPSTSSETTSTTTTGIDDGFDGRA